MALGFHEAKVIHLCLIMLDGFFFHENIEQLLKFMLNLQHSEHHASNFFSITVHRLNSFHLILSSSCVRKDLSASSCNFWFS